MNELYLLGVVVAATAVAAYYPGEVPILPVPTECPPTNDGDAVHIAHESDCTKFYKCDWGRKVKLECPYMNEDKDRLHFNKILQVCDWPWSAGCNSSSPNTTTTEEPTTTTTEEPTTTTTQEPTTTTTEEPTTTTEEPTTTTTEEPSTTTTEEPSTTTEESSTTPDDSFLTPSTTPEIPNLPTECPKGPGAIGVVIPDPEDCKGYFVCHEDGTSEWQECDDNLVFDPRLGMCDEDDGTICSHIPTTTPDPKECPEVDDPENPVIYPHECQCDKYYICQNGQVIRKRCPKGQGFDIDKKKCVPRGEAKCVKYDGDDESNYLPIANQTSSNQNISQSSKESFFLRLFHWDQ